MSDPGRRRPGTLRPTGPAPLVVFAVVGLVAGWSVRSLSLRTGRVEPTVPWLAVLLIFFSATILAVVAFVTRRTVTRARPDLAAHVAVNRLVLGKACALVGALLAGGYAGYAVAQLGVGEPAALTRMWRSALAALGGVALLASSLWLENSCRVEDDPETLEGDAN